MCKLGDIIVIDQFKNELGSIVKRHSFVVINDEGNYIEGLRYDFVCNMLCSFHDDKHRKKKLSYKENMLILNNDITIKNGNDLEGFIKADQLYYFNKKNIKYYIVGNINPDALNRLFMLMMTLIIQKRDKQVLFNIRDNN